MASVIVATALLAGCSVEDTGAASSPDAYLSPGTALEDSAAVSQAFPALVDHAIWYGQSSDVQATTVYNLSSSIFEHYRTSDNHSGGIAPVRAVLLQKGRETVVGDDSLGWTFSNFLGACGYAQTDVPVRPQADDAVTFFFDAADTAYFKVYADDTFECAYQPGGVFYGRLPATAFLSLAGILSDYAGATLADLFNGCFPQEYWIEDATYFNASPSFAASEMDGYADVLQSVLKESRREALTPCDRPGSGDRYPGMRFWLQAYGATAFLWIYEDDTFLLTCGAGEYTGSLCGGAWSRLLQCERTALPTAAPIPDVDTVGALYALLFPEGTVSNGMGVSVYTSSMYDLDSRDYVPGEYDAGLYDRFVAANWEQVLTPGVLDTGSELPLTVYLYMFGSARYPDDRFIYGYWNIYSTGKFHLTIGGDYEGVFTGKLAKGTFDMLTDQTFDDR